jgi:hypothetical protein
MVTLLTLAVSNSLFANDKITRTESEHKYFSLCNLFPLCENELLISIKASK